MVISKEAHRTYLLELIEKSMFPGSVLDEAVELRNEIINAKVAKSPPPKASK